MTEVYTKIGRKYMPMGYTFDGFPTAGFWIVLDGSQNCIYQLDKSVMGPIPKLDHSRHISTIVDKLMTCPKSMSMMDIVKQVCIYFDERIVRDSN